MNRTISIIIGILIVLGIGYLVYVNKKAPVIPIENTGGQTTSTTTSNPSPSPSATPTPTSTNPSTGSGSPPSASTPSGIAMAQVALHGSRTSCWAAINGNVYDLTSWIPNHPGGEAAILSLCGKDGTAQFNGKHGGDSKPKTVLAGFKLGVLAQ